MKIKNLENMTHQGKVQECTLLGLKTNGHFIIAFKYLHSIYPKYNIIFHTHIFIKKNQSKDMMKLKYNEFNQIVRKNFKKESKRT